jgi:hypothetical protein
MKRRTLAIIIAGAVIATAPAFLVVLCHRVPIAVRQLQAEANSGDAAAQFELGKLYVSGSDTIAKDPHWPRSGTHARQTLATPPVPQRRCISDRLSHVASLLIRQTPQPPSSS